MPRSFDRIEKIANTYKDYIKCDDLKLSSSSVIRYTHPKCGHEYTTKLLLFSQRKQFEYCASCVKKDHGIHSIFEKIPLQYRDNVRFIDDINVSGYDSRIEYTNLVCGHKSNLTIYEFLKRSQLDRCKKCINKKDDYLDRIPSKYHDCFLVKPT